MGKDANGSTAGYLARKRGNQAAHNARLKEAAVMSGFPTIGKLARAILDGDVVVTRKRVVYVQERGDGEVLTDSDNNTYMVGNDVFDALFCGG